jgi:hypothetical protein
MNFALEPLKHLLCHSNYCKNSTLQPKHNLGEVETRIGGGRFAVYLRMSAAGPGAPESASNKGIKADARDTCYHDRVC